MENRSLVRDLVEWIAKNPRPYAEVMDAWKTSCPRLSIWEEAVDRGYVTRYLGDDNRRMVRVTNQGRNFLESESLKEMA